MKSPTSCEEVEDLKEVVLNLPNRIGTHAEPRTLYVLPQYEQKLRRFARHLERFGSTFVVSMLLLAPAIPIAAVVVRHSLLGLAAALIGILLIAFPFATPETVKRLGFGSSIVVARAVGGMVIILGAYLAIGRSF